MASSVCTLVGYYMASSICTLLVVLYGFMYMHTVRGIIWLHVYVHCWWYYMASCICTLLGGV